MEEPPAKTTIEGGGRFSLIGEDIHQDILSRLPAPTFASAACVNRSWNLLCNRLLTRPKLLSALSLNPNLQDAVKEVLDKVLAEPIQPHFAIAYVGQKFNLHKTLDILVSKLGSWIPIIVSEARGIIGADAVTNEHKEIQWMEDDENGYNLRANRHRGVVLTVGFLPGLKVKAIPLMKEIEGDSQSYTDVSTVDEFVTDVRGFTVSVSRCVKPVGIIMFAGPQVDMKAVLEKMDNAMPKDTIVVGNESGHFLCNFGVDSTISSGRDRNMFSWAAGLVFATDAGKPQGIGEIHFSLMKSSGLSPIGPIYKGASVRAVRDDSPTLSTWLTARRDGSMEILDGESILHEIENVIENNDLNTGDLYIGVSKRRKCFIGSEKGKFVSTTSFHEVSGGDEEYLYVEGAGIKTGDTFQFYYPDPQIALMSRNDVFEKFKAMKQQSNNDKMIVCGGLIFPCYGRGESFLGSPNVDSSAFLTNFPNVPLSGVFCSGEIGRGFSTSTQQHNDGQESSNCYLHVYSTMYLLILYTPQGV